MKPNPLFIMGAATVLEFLCAATFAAIVWGKLRKERKEKSDLLGGLHTAHAQELKDMAMLHDAQLRQVNMAAQSFHELNGIQNEIGVFLREEYKAEIASGYHTGRSLSEIIIGYLRKERECHKAK